MANFDQSILLQAIETELKEAVATLRQPGMEMMHAMLAYHMGWEGEGAGPEATGKRIRPMLVLLTCASAGGDWQKALAAAAAVELIHNFSLIHDDIQDNSPLRRGRPTVWKKWGVAQAINAGDAMFTLAHLTMLRIQTTTSPETALLGAQILQETCLDLTKGQFMDLAYEARGDLNLEAYWPMVEGKTAALLATCTDLGALVAQVDPHRRSLFRSYGRSLGLAFQVQDDLLGIWGDSTLTGKSTASDLASGKKSLPVLFGLRQAGDFAKRWSQGPVSPEEAPEMAAQLEREGARGFTRETAVRLTQEAQEALEQANPQGPAGEALRSLTARLLSRKS